MEPNINSQPTTPSPTPDIASDRLNQIPPQPAATPDDTDLTSIPQQQTTPQTAVFTPVENASAQSGGDLQGVVQHIPKVPPQEVNAQTSSTARGEAFISSVTYNLSWLDKNRKGTLAYDGTNIMLVDEVGNTVFNYPLTTVSRVKKVEFTLHIIFNRTKYFISFGNITSYIAAGSLMNFGAIGLVASQVVNKQQQKSTDINEWVQLFTQAGVMKKPLLPFLP